MAMMNSNGKMEGIWMSKKISKAFLAHISAKMNIEFGLISFIIIISINKNSLIINYRLINNYFKLIIF